MSVPAFIAVVLAGLLTGSELTSWAIVHPTLWKLEHRAQVRAEKLMYRRFASIDPFLMTATVLACFVAAGTLDGRSSTLALIGAICFATMLVMTLIGNMPLNLRVFVGTKSTAIRTNGAGSAAAGTAFTPCASCSTAPGSSWSRSPRPQPDGGPPGSHEEGSRLAATSREQLEQGQRASGRGRGALTHPLGALRQVERVRVGVLSIT